MLWPLSDNSLHNSCAAIDLEFQSLVQNIRAIKPDDAIVENNPDIHWHYALKNQVALHEYETTTPIKCKNIATSSIYRDILKIKSAIIAAIGAKYFEED